jgi:hypothetical protein
MADARDIPREQIPERAIPNGAVKVLATPALLVG